MHAHLIEVTDFQQKVIKTVSDVSGRTEAQVIERMVELFFNQAEDLANAID